MSMSTSMKAGVFPSPGIRCVSRQSATTNPAPALDTAFRADTLRYPPAVNVEGGRTVEVDIGPVEFIVLGFPGNRFKGEIVPALADLVESETIRIIDLAFVKKDADGSITTIELEELDDDEAAGIGSHGDVGDLISAADLERAAEALEPNNSAAVLVWENTWAARFAQAVRNADGIVLENMRIPHDVVQAAIEFAAENEGE